MKVLVQPFCGIRSGNKSLKYSMKLISYFHNIIGDGLLPNFGTKFRRLFAMATFHTSQCQDGDRNVKCYHGMKMSGH